MNCNHTIGIERNCEHVYLVNQEECPRGHLDVEFKYCPDCGEKLTEDEND